ncbi:hypothetical protein [Ochrobactrum chromiisoli]|uniref:Uncharacterized protein n=1 Tax=Ochrobactrum chromiisoli TaxID=2993941 RepID=A0ABT3QUR7_9HYPH|nr:hypothetical protein [Ochrobactrum chromiisoli]MCX2699355.1 hypothetical protein [Ochrobactrum chromiisoli]
MANELIAEAITDYFGGRCLDYAEGCPTCEAWAEYDRMNTRPAAPVEGLEPIAWPINLVNMPDTDDADARILGFRIRAGDEAFGEYGLSEALQWLKKACMDSVYGSQAETIIAAKDADNASLIHDLNRIKDHETSLVNDNAALTERVRELTSPEYLTEKLEQVGVVDKEWQERAETLETQLAAAKKVLTDIQCIDWDGLSVSDVFDEINEIVERADLEAKP